MSRSPIPRHRALLAGFCLAGALSPAGGHPGRNPGCGTGQRGFLATDRQPPWSPCACSGRSTHPPDPHPVARRSLPEPQPSL
ncbi:hypothetical protein ACPA9J_35360 [Pseudomonas aeruginosa]